MVSPTSCHRYNFVINMSQMGTILVSLNFEELDESTQHWVYVDIYHAKVTGMDGLVQLDSIRKRPFGIRALGPRLG